jgi:hypothetical protein
MTSNTPSRTTTDLYTSSQTPGAPYTPWTTDAPSKGAVRFSIFIVVVLLLILIGYIFFAAYFFAREIPRGVEQRRHRVERAARAAKEALLVDPGFPHSDDTSRPAPRLIKTGTARARRLADLKAKRDHGESYEMADLSHVKHTSQHIRWQDQVSQSSSTPPPRGARGLEGDIDPRLLEARLWSGLSASNIEDVDDRARIAALQQLRKMQRPVKTDLGDDGLWSPRWAREDERDENEHRRR